jgi:hypothetical protein
MTPKDFQKVGQSEKRIYGPRKLLLCGYNAADRKSFLTMLKISKLATIPVIFTETDSLELTLKELFEKEAKSTLTGRSDMQRAVIMAGITEQELHTLIRNYRSSGMPTQFWAALTPISEGWRLQDLLVELSKENEMLRNRQRRKEKP